MRYTTGHDKRLREARRADALAAELMRTRAQCDALADALRDVRRIAEGGQRLSVRVPPEQLMRLVDNALAALGEEQ